jgi:predicted transcriptional regulator
MSTLSDKYTSLLKPFGLNTSEVKVYTYLLGKKASSVLSISKGTNITRTKIYYILDKLIDKGLIRKTGKKNASRYSANSYEQLSQIINRKKVEIEMLESSLPTVFEELSSLQLKNSSKSDIRHYKGIEGLKTVTWNSTKARGTLRLFELATDLGTFLDFDFAERVRLEFVNQGLDSSKQLTNISKFGPWTNIEEFVEIWKCKYISTNALHFEVETLVYNDVVAMYQFRDEEMFCIEIYNRDLAQNHKNLFDYLWKNAKKMQKLDKRGSVKVKEILKTK